MKQYYDGDIINSSNTAIHSPNPSPAVRWLVEKCILVKGMTVLDYGAGYGRNAKFLRDEGLSVYAHDPHNGTNDGYDHGWNAVSTRLPVDKMVFDTFLTSFVLNVVPKKVEADIIAYGQGLDQIHIVRNRDLRVSVTNSLQRGCSTVGQWYDMVYDIGGKRSFNVDELCTYGVKTSRGFQRYVDLQDYGLGIEHQTHGYKIFMK